METLHQFRGLAEQVVVDTSEELPTFLLIGKNGKHLRLSPSAYHLLSQVNSGVSFATLAKQIRDQDGRPVSPAKVEQAYQYVLDQIAEAELKRNRASSLWLRIPCFSADLVERIAILLSILFHPVVAFCISIGIATTLVLLVLLDGPLDFSAKRLGLGYVFLFASLIAHEFGHASACVRYGAKPSEIGIGIYLIYPVLYSDVTSAWKLKRWQRVVVDLGGMFFQLMVGAVYATAYLLFGLTSLKVGVLLVLLSCFFSLNPLLRFDGYWIVSDVLGVTNLRRQPSRIVRHFWERLHGRPVAPLPWSVWVIRGLFLYTVILAGFWGRLIWMLGTFLWNVTVGLYAHFGPQTRIFLYIVLKQGWLVFCWSSHTCALCAGKLLL